MRSLDLPTAIERGRSVANRYTQSNGALVAAGLAFFTFFALAPAAIAIGAIAGVFLSPADVSRAWQELTSRSPDSLSALAPAVNGLTQLAMSASGGVALITGLSALIVAIYAASKSVYGLRLAMTAAMSGGVPRSGFALRILSAVAALVVIVAVVAGLTLVTLLPSFLRVLGLESPAGTRVALINWVVVALVCWALVYLTFRHAPVERVDVRWSSPGVLVSVIWILGATAAFGLYSAWSSAVGAALLVYGAPIALLLWLYLVAVGLLLGAVVQAGSRRRPRDAQADGPGGTDSERGT